MKNNKNKGISMRIGYTCGVFDLFHVGHLNLLENAKRQCDYLIVGVCSDEYVREIKHKEPVINELDRTRILNALKCVDKAEIVSIEETFNKILAYKRFGFNVLFFGSDWKGTPRFLETERQFKDNNIELEVVFFDYTQGISTSQMKNELTEKK